MRFFNIDMHVSVVEDISTCFRWLGHEVDSHLMSAHHWALGRPLASHGTGDPNNYGAVGYGPINLDAWFRREIWDTNDDPSAFTRVSDDLRNKCPELDAYNGFIATYPASFALLYQRFRGHIVVDMPVRYEYPFTTRPRMWSALNEFLVRGVNDGKTTIVANNRYDALYYEYFTGQSIERISGTCDYVNRLAPRWSPRTSHLLGFGNADGCREMESSVPEVLHVRDIHNMRRYDHTQISAVRGIVWVPYNVSIMSFFEHYQMCIPLFVPSQKLALDLKGRGLALDQLSWHKDTLGGSAHPRVETDMPDPHTRAGVEAWMQTYDFYDAGEFPHITYFDSWSDLKDKIASTNFEDVSARMAAHNDIRKKRNSAAWERVLARVIRSP